MAVQKAKHIYRDFQTDGVPSSGASKPKKRELREWGTYVENSLLGASAGAIIYDSKADMEADTSQTANAMAWVLGDPVAANNGIYQFDGTSTWTRLGDLPYSYIKASNAGAGTANAIVATTDVPVPAADGGALIALPIVADNTAAVTVAFNGATALVIKTNSGNDVIAGGLTAGMIVAGYVSGATFRLLSDQASAAIVAAAEASAVAADASADRAEVAADAAEDTLAGSVKKTDISTAEMEFVIDEDDMASDSATKVPTQQSAKAYTDTKAPLETGLTGTVTADSSPGNFSGYAINEWAITDDATVGDTADPSRQAYGIHINYSCGGDTLRGTRSALSVYATLAEASKDEIGGAQNYVAVQAIASAASDDNGTDTGSGAKGAVFAFNPVAQLGADATNMLHLSCGEINIGAVAGSSMRYKSMLNFAPYPNDAVQGTEVDAGLWFYKQGASAVGFEAGILFSNEVQGTTGLSFVEYDGTLLRAEGGGTNYIGIDFSDWNFTGAVLKSKGFTIGAHGNVSASGSVQAINADSTAEINAVRALVPTSQGDALGVLNFGYGDPDSFVATPSAYIIAISNDAWTLGSSHPTDLVFFATASGGTEPAQQMSLIPDVAIAGKTPMFLNVGGTLTQVEVGANDTAGSGYRQLRVANGS